MSEVVALVVVLALALPGCASYRLIRDGALDTDAVARIQTRLVALRGLSFQTPVPVAAVSQAEARDILERELHAQFTPGELRKLTRVYTALGLFPDGTDLEHAILDLYGTQVAGFYEPIGRRMVLVEGTPPVDLLTRIVEGISRRDLAGELVLGHELTHALQDQHFGLDVGRGDVGEDDALLARHAVYEGDATLAGFAVMLGTLRPSVASSLAAKLEGVPGQLAGAYPDIPAAIRETVVFQYVAGVNFVSWAYERAGWDGVNALLARPPLSSEQIMHPEKYFVRPELPLTIHVGATSPYLQAGWELAEEATLGEFTTRLLLERFLDRARAGAVAEGWDGDRMIALSRGTDLALLWLTSWDSERDAGEFFDAYGEVLAGKHQGAQPIVRGDRIVVSGDAPLFPRAARRQGARHRGCARSRQRAARGARLAPQHLRAGDPVGADRSRRIDARRRRTSARAPAHGPTRARTPRRRRFRTEPREIRRRAGDDRQRDHLGNVVAVQRPHTRRETRHERPPGLDHQQHLAGALDRATPPVDRGEGRDQVDAGGEPLLDERRRQTLGFGARPGGAEHDGEVSGLLHEPSPAKRPPLASQASINRG